MASRRERCSYCYTHLLIPRDAQSVRCPACYNITRFQVPIVTNNPPPCPAIAPPPMYGRKKALLCGVSYRGKSSEINSCINDVNCMRNLLVERMGFPDESIITLTEDEAHPTRIPTKANMRMALKWLVQGCKAGDSLVFHFSGLGSKQRDYGNDEADGFDETLLPLDFETEGSIADDEINATIVRPLPHGVTLHAIIDASHSETALDLPYVCRMNREGCYMWEDQRCAPWAAYKGTSGGLAISFGACNDDQVCMDTTAFAGGNTSTGVLTSSFIYAVQNEPGLTYGHLLNSMRSAIRVALTGGLGLNAPIASQVNIAQVPQLSSSEKFQIYSKKFVL